MMLEMPPILSLDDVDAWPDLAEAFEWRDGLVAIGGDLTINRLLSAYQRGIFPWYSDGQPICWWALQPRMILKPEEVYVGRSLRKLLRNKPYVVTMNDCFHKVMSACAQTARVGQVGTWITAEMQRAYFDLHEAGHAHSFECWYPDQSGQLQLAGGLYGVQIGRVFFGESMFAWQNDASKIAFSHAVDVLKSRGIQVIDCQMHTEHLERFGAREIEFDIFQKMINELCHLALTKPLSKEILCSNKIE